MNRASVLLAFLLVAAVGCGGDDNNGGGADASVGNLADADPLAPDADPTQPDAIPSSSFTTLVSRSFTIPAGQEFYRCTRLTVTEDTYIAGFRAMSPLGTHHTVLSIENNPTEPDGDFNCSAGTNAHGMLFASGVGTDDMVFPSGVAMKVSAGSQLLLNLHLYNVSESEITGTSGTQVMAIPASAVEQEAEFTFAGTLFLNISGSMPNQEQTASGGCTFDADQTVLAVWPHMHQLGTHMKVTHEGNTIHDKPYDFNEQINYPITPLLVRNGDRINVTCTYINNTGQNVMFGDSSNQEMCFAGLYRYPATGAGLFDCSGF